jgi:hypothetical protein
METNLSRLPDDTVHVAICWRRFQYSELELGGPG